MPEMPLKKISSFFQSEIDQLFKKAKVKVRYSGVRVLVAPAQGSFGRILIVTPKKCGNAPQRNLFKRRVRALFRENRLSEHHKDFVVIVDKRGIAIPFSKLRHLLLCAAQNDVR